VIGTTNQVSGEIAVDYTSPGETKVGTILVNARSLVTDNDFRNRAINNEILETREYEFITFTPTMISGFPDSPNLGEEISFQITGDLTIRDITRQVTFDVTATAQSETRMVGSASSVVARADFDLEIPSVPSVADVDENVRLEIDFVAEK
jgi:polyisoprenoid-binding protein YceI